MNKRYRILIIEDHRELARVLRTGIESLGEHFIVLDVPSGEEALLETHRTHIDLAIVDMRLPGIDGPELVQRLRQRQPQIKIFLISGQEEDKIRSAATTIQADAWFHKPLELADMLDAMERTLGLANSIFGRMPGPISRVEEEEAVGRISDLLSDLREATQARAVVLLNEVGRVVLQAGSLGQQALPPKALLTLASLHTTSVRLTHIMQSQQPYVFFCCHFDNFILHFSIVNAQYALLLIYNIPYQYLTLDAVTTQIQTTLTGLRQIMESLGIAISERMASAMQSDDPPAEDHDIPTTNEDFVALLEQELPSDEAEAFWEVLSDVQSSTSPMNPDVLTYEQARRLGLAPAED